MNRFQFLGRLTKDTEIRYGANNAKVAIFDIAVNRKFTNQQGQRETDFFKVTTFGKLADICEKHLKKGRQIVVEGRIQNRTWEDQAGIKKYATDFIGEAIYFADSKKEEEKPVAEEMTFDEIDDLPF